MRLFTLPLALLIVARLSSQPLQTPFERSAGKQTATYAECIDFYKQLDKLSPALSIRVMGMSDAGCGT